MREPNNRERASGVGPRRSAKIGAFGGLVSVSVSVSQIFFCSRENVSRCIAAGRKKLEIRYVLSELDGFVVAGINRNRAFDFSPE